MDSALQRRSLNADKLIGDIFSKAIEIGKANEVAIFQEARMRVAIGDPPGKGGSLGDAIHWLSLLKEAPHGEDLHLISDDGDYYSPLAESKIKDYLQDEWRQQKGSNIHLHKRLSKFFAANFPDAKKAAEIELDLLVSSLESSGSFETTHKVVAELGKLTGFTRKHANRIVRAALGRTKRHHAWPRSFRAVDQSAITECQKVVRPAGGDLDDRCNRPIPNESPDRRHGGEPRRAVENATDDQAVPLVEV